MREQAADVMPAEKRAARALILSGRVQSVGFRPFVYRLANSLALTGHVRNLSGQVLIHIEGTPAALDAFEERVVRDAPRLARPVLAAAKTTSVSGCRAFEIVASRPSAAADVHLPPDQSTCPECLAELADPSDRRFGYPFINCTACGPRYTIIEGLPYDRAATSMASFQLCAACKAEYEDPADRRFHAEPVACPDCGPSLTFSKCGDVAGVVTGNAAAVDASVVALRAGEIVAVRGIGGYHLMCDAANDAAIARLRRRKHRPHKPLAVMFPVEGARGLDAVQRSVDFDEATAEQILDPSRPIVLAARRSDCGLSRLLAPGLSALGVFLPYSPLHHLLLAAFGAPLVATSGNVSGEPVITEYDEAHARLGAIADAFLHHDREIVRSADDPVFRQIAGRMRAIRLGRGTAPLEMTLPERLDSPLLAVGGQGKVTMALGIGDRLVISPHIGDLDTARAYDQFTRLAHDLPRLYSAAPRAVVCDLHPGFTGTRWAMAQDLPVISVQHHVAHASALAAEHHGVGRWLVFAWDGVGYGDDGTLWGGEALIGAPGQWRRVASFRPFRPPGGDLAAHAPWRSAAALMWEAGHEYAPPLAPQDAVLIRLAWQKNVNAPQTSAVGRLFDAAAALISGITETSFEGQGGMQLEQLAASALGTDDPEAIPFELSRDDAGILRSDWSGLLQALSDSSQPPEIRALRFHVSVAEALVSQVHAIGKKEFFDAVGLTGGVFQNRVLSEMVIARLEAKGYRVVLPALVPANDGGLAAGQVVEAAARLARQQH